LNLSHLVKTDQGHYLNVPYPAGVDSEVFPAVGHDRWAILWHLQSGAPSQAVGVPGDLHQMAMMEQAIQDRRDGSDFPEDLPPLTETLVGGQQSGIAFVPSVDQWKSRLVPFWPIDTFLVDAGFLIPMPGKTIETRRLFLPGFADCHQESTDRKDRIASLTGVVFSLTKPPVSR
jgi:hypothetical protein